MSTDGLFIFGYSFTLLINILKFLSQNSLTSLLDVFQSIFEAIVSSVVSSIFFLGVSFVYRKATNFSVLILLIVLFSYMNFLVKHLESFIYKTILSTNTLSLFFFICIPFIPFICLIALADT